MPQTIKVTWAREAAEDALAALIRFRDTNGDGAEVSEQNVMCAIDCLRALLDPNMSLIEDLSVPPWMKPWGVDCIVNCEGVTTADDDTCSECGDSEYVTTLYEVNQLWPGGE